MPRPHGSVVALRALALLLVPWCADQWLHLELLPTMLWIRLSMAPLAKVLEALPVVFLVALASSQHPQHLHASQLQAAQAQPHQGKPLNNWLSSLAALTGTMPRTCNSKQQGARQSRRVQKYSKLKV